MDERSIVAEKLRKKLLEIQTLEEKLRTAKVYVQALQDVMRAMGTPIEDGRGKTAPKAGSAVSQARDAILTAGRPVHVSELLAALGREDTRETRASLTSALAAYVRRGEIFTRPVPNTFGLAELDHHATPEDEPPEGFGREAADLDDEIPF